MRLTRLLFLLSAAVNIRVSSQLPAANINNDYRESVWLGDSAAPEYEDILIPEVDTVTNNNEIIPKSDIFIGGRRSDLGSVSDKNENTTQDVPKTDIFIGDGSDGLTSITEENEITTQDVPKSDIFIGDGSSDLDSVTDENEISTQSVSKPKENRRGENNEKEIVSDNLNEQSTTEKSKVDSMNQSPKYSSSSKSVTALEDDSNTEKGSSATFIPESFTETINIGTSSDPTLHSTLAENEVNPTKKSTSSIYETTLAMSTVSSSESTGVGSAATSPKSSTVESVTGVASTTPISSTAPTAASSTTLPQTDSDSSESSESDSSESHRRNSFYHRIKEEASILRKKCISESIQEFRKKMRPENAFTMQSIRKSFTKCFAQYEDKLKESRNRRHLQGSTSHSHH